MFDIKDYVDKGFVLEAAKESPIRLCGFIVYSRKNPHVSMALRDIDYWKELDAISGVNWPIFAIRPVAPKSSYTRHDAMRDDADEEIVRMCLDMNNEELPCFVCFMWNDDGELEKVSHKIDDKTSESTHNDLREIVTRVADVINDIKPEYYQSENVFRNVVNAVESYNTTSKISHYVKNSKWMIEMFGKLILGMTKTRI